MLHLLEAYSHIPCLLNTHTYLLYLMITLVMLSLRAVYVATVLLYKNVWTVVAKFKWYRLGVIHQLSSDV